MQFRQLERVVGCRINWIAVLAKGSASWSTAAPQGHSAPFGVVGHWGDGRRLMAGCNLRLGQAGV
jgi:hypothetical protein